MDLVSNYIGEILPSQLTGKQGAVQNIDLSDNTFSDMLAKQMENKIQENINNLVGQINIPAGLDIGIFDGTDTNIHPESTEPVNKINGTENSSMPNFKDTKDMTTSEVLTFAESLFDTKPTLTDTKDTGLFNFERKLAANSYGKYSRSIVTDLQDFISDALKLN